MTVTGGERWYNGGMSIAGVVAAARSHLSSRGVGGWLLYDYRGMNPIFWETVGPVSNVTRPCWLWIPAEGEARLLVAYVDQGRFGHLGLATTLYSGREDMVSRLGALIGGAGRVAMEYSPTGELPRISRVDAGTVELVRSLGVDVVSSADTVQYAAQRWTGSQLASHEAAADALGLIVRQAFDHIGGNLAGGVTEHDVAEFIRARFVEEGLVVTDGPVVAVNEHSSDPHFEPTPASAATIRRGDWVLIDLWSRFSGADSMFADITWTAFVGDHVPERHQAVFDAVTGARDLAVGEIEAAFREGRTMQGWQADRAARDFIEAAGFGGYFSHRLGHSLGREVHGNAVNLDGWETRDTREIMPGIAVTIEPGVYLPEEFGVRSEIDVYIADEGPRVTTEVQREVVLIRD